MKNGEWILLDEVNLASDETLNTISSLLASNQFFLVEENCNIIPHKDFRLFCCMNPHHSSAGKKKLPVGLWNWMTEFFIDEVLDKEELREIVKRGLSCVDSSQIIEGIINFYINVKHELHWNAIRYGTTKPSIGLRNLSWMMSFVWNALNLYGLERSIIEAIHLHFLPQFDLDS